MYCINTATYILQKTTYLTVQAPWSERAPHKFIRTMLQTELGLYYKVSLIGSFKVKLSSSHLLLEGLGLYLKRSSPSASSLSFCLSSSAASLSHSSSSEFFARLCATRSEPPMILGRP
uniref:Uncharacterized protein n=1 Tax=Anguilla anguilla TaxID=7936 RepID=A0A0E9W3G2_ANGAN